MSYDYNENPEYCENCNTIMNLSVFDNDLKDKYYLFCKKCIKDMKICSKSKCKKIFLFNDLDLKNLKKIYIDTNSAHQFYLFSDVEQLIINKYESIDVLDKLIKQRHQEKQKRNNKIINQKIEREKKLKELFIVNKLEYKNYGDCYSYIHYGEPSLEQVLENELNKLKIKNQRRILLANELYKLHIPLDENLKSCYEFINNLSSKELHDVVRCIEVEYFLKNNTNYMELSKIHGHAIAQEMAIREYAQNQKLPKNIDNKYNRIKLEFE
ncbi:XPA domain-containing protein [Fadolivirus algeromassiliense]|jgi:hypothetical protein|uniref:XPA domain-containing protein n=1 Tax=Fadolivirus FV1/VV64 TaxID=3070911 RepID=A0A7D3R0G1_9VIRU|nr:XPA domain-containing protein [Fadolivirus algeromassiliense]QKF93621.1 XPA domain-containing protein [Fadolivirus FV1/VV64]